MSTEARSLRNIFSLATAALAALVILVCGSLVVMTTLLRRATADAAAAVETVHLVEAVTIELLLHERAQDVVLRKAGEVKLRRMLAAAADHVTSPEEAEALDNSRVRMDAYLRAAHEPAATNRELHASAYGALDELVAINVRQARAAHDDSASWDAFANVQGIATAVLMMFLAVWLLRWLRVGAFQPIGEIALAMERMGHGERLVSLPEAGAAELRYIARTFNEMAAALRDQRQSQMAFLAAAAHDLRNPLTTLGMSVGMVRPDRPLPPEDRIRRTLEVVSRQLALMERMTNDLIDTARIEAGQLELKPGIHDLGLVVRSACSLFERSAPQHPLEVVLPDAPVTARCDSLRVEQVITNLVSNAIKYSSPDTPIKVNLACTGDDAVLRVTDEGPGMSSDDQARLFRPFVRGACVRNIPGLGLGLFSVQRIVEAHHGSVTVESELGVGTTFVVTLPLDRDGSLPVNGPPCNELPQ